MFTRDHGTAEVRLSGRLIVVEGVSRSGKSTLIRALASEIGPALVTEWNSDDVIKPVTDSLKASRRLDPISFSLIHLLDFQQRYMAQILPALKSGQTVICDRYLYTSIARDRCRGVHIGETLVHEYYQPDVCVYIEPDFEQVAARFMSSAGKYGYYGLGQDIFPAGSDLISFLRYQKQQHIHYIELAKQYGFLRWPGQSNHSIGDIVRRIPV